MRIGSRVITATATAAAVIVTGAALAAPAQAKSRLTVAAPPTVAQGQKVTVTSTFQLDAPVARKICLQRWVVTQGRGSWVNQTCAERGRLAWGPVVARTTFSARGKGPVRFRAQVWQKPGPVWVGARTSAPVTVMVR